MADRNIMLNELGELLNRYAAKFDTGRAYSDYGENHYAENNVRDILNKLMCWNFVNANAAKPNAPGVDLIDEERKICIQISSTVS